MSDNHNLVHQSKALLNADSLIDWCVKRERTNWRIVLFHCIPGYLHALCVVVSTILLFDITRFIILNADCSLIVQALTVAAEYVFEHLLADRKTVPAITMLSSVWRQPTQPKIFNHPVIVSICPKYWLVCPVRNCCFRSKWLLRDNLTVLTISTNKNSSTAQRQDTKTLSNPHWWYTTLQLIEAGPPQLCRFIWTNWIKQSFDYLILFLMIIHKYLHSITLLHRQV